jgi:hypothetical protein
MNSDKVVKLLEYMTERYDVVVGGRSMYTILYPKDISIFVQGKTLCETLEKFCKELMKHVGKQFEEVLEEILNE